LDEDAITVAGGRASLASAHVAQRITAAPDGLAFTHEFVRQAAASPACGTRPPS
jgi:hypothetical protein